MTVTDVIGAFFDGMTLLAVLIAAICIAAAVEMAGICFLVTYFEWRDHRRARRRPGYITDEIVGSPWRHR